MARAREHGQRGARHGDTLPRRPPRRAVELLAGLRACRRCIAASVLRLPRRAAQWRVEGLLRPTVAGAAPELDRLPVHQGRGILAANAPGRKKLSSRPGRRPGPMRSDVATGGPRPSPGRRSRIQGSRKARIRREFIRARHPARPLRRRARPAAASRSAGSTPGSPRRSRRRPRTHRRAPRTARRRRVSGCGWCRTCRRLCASASRFPWEGREPRRISFRRGGLHRASKSVGAHAPPTAGLAPGFNPRETTRSRRW